MIEPRSKFSELMASSQFFWREASINAIEASSGRDDRWQLALLHIMISVEHTLKMHLVSIHPVLVRAEFRNADKTVSIDTALDRLADKEIGSVLLSPLDIRTLKSALRLRNAIAHGLLDQPPEALRSKFCTISEFVRSFQFRHHGIHYSEVLGQDTFDKLQEIKELARESRRRALDALKEAGIEYGDYQAFCCPECFDRFVTIEDNEATCHYCYSVDTIFYCNQCGETKPSFEMRDFSEYFDNDFADYDYPGNSFGYSYSTCCESCYPVIIKDIQEQRDTQYYEDILMEEEHSRMRGLI